jgi:hypothetical protein
MYLFGGWVRTSIDPPAWGVSNELWKYDFGQSTWTQLASGDIPARAAHAAVMVGSLSNFPRSETFFASMAGLVVPSARVKRCVMICGGSR